MAIASRRHVFRPGNDPFVLARTKQRTRLRAQQVMEARGYPVGDFEQRAEDVSVHHATVVDHYRAAHAIAVRDERGEATTEDLRLAIKHYRALFDDLLEVDENAPRRMEARG